MNDKKKMLEGKLYIASADPALRVCGIFVLLLS